MLPRFASVKIFVQEIHPEKFSTNGDPTLLLKFDSKVNLNIKYREGSSIN